MKRLMLTMLVAGFLAGAASAQTGSAGQSSSSTSVSSTGGSKARKGKKLKKAPSETLNNRREYKGKNGQTATPTGHEASPTNGSYQSLKKDTAARKQQDDE